MHAVFLARAFQVCLHVLLASIAVALIAPVRRLCWRLLETTATGREPKQNRGDQPPSREDEQEGNSPDANATDELIFQLLRRKCYATEQGEHEACELDEYSTDDDTADREAETSRSRLRSMTDTSSPVDSSDAEFGADAGEDRRHDEVETDESDDPMDEEFGTPCSRVRRMTETPDGLDWSDADFGLASVDLEGMNSWRRKKTRAMTINPGPAQIGSRDSDFGLSDNQLLQLQQMYDEPRAHQRESAVDASLADRGFDGMREEHVISDEVNDSAHQRKTVDFGLTSVEEVNVYEVAIGDDSSDEDVDVQSSRVRSLTESCNEVEYSDADFGLATRDIEGMNNWCRTKYRTMTLHDVDEILPESLPRDSDFGLSDAQLDELQRLYSEVTDGGAESCDDCNLSEHRSNDANGRAGLSSSRGLAVPPFEASGDFANERLDVVCAKTPWSEAMASTFKDFT